MNNKQVKKYSAIVMIAFLFSINVYADNPTLFFDSSDIPALQSKIQQPEFAAIYNDIYQRAYAYCNPGSPDYVDPCDPWFQNGDFGWYGRDVQSWVEPIGFVYQMTGDDYFGQHGAAILAAAAQYEAPDGSLLEKNNDMMRTLAVGYDWLSSAMTPSQKTLIEQVSREYIIWTIDNTWGPYHNFMGVMHGGNGLLAMAMRDVYPSEADGWVTNSKDQLLIWFNTGFDSQGAYYEGHDYVQYGFSNALAFGDALLRNDGIDIFNNSNLRQYPHYLSQIRLPGEDTYEGRNDAYYSAGLEETVLRLVSAWQDGLTRWLWDSAQDYWTKDYHLGGYSPMRILWSNDVNPVNVENSSEPLAEHFEGRGLVTFRTGWSDNDVLFTIEAGPYYEVTHNQADKGHFGLYGYGQRWAVDTVYGNNRDPNGRCQTVAHNCILVDGVGQALSGASYGTDGEILAYENTSRYGYALADCTQAYNTNNHGQPGAVVQKAHRHSIFVRGDEEFPSYAVILDDIVKDTSVHDYTWQLLTWDDMDIDVSGSQPLVSPRDYVTTPRGSSGSGTCTWQVNPQTSGTFYIWAQAGVSKVSDLGGSTNSFYVNIDNTGQDLFDFNGSWELVGTHYTLFPEQFEIEFSTRERGAKLYRVWVTTDPDAIPPAENKSDGGILLLPDTADIISPMELVTSDEEMKIYMSAQSVISYSVDMYEPGDGRTPDGFPRLRAVSNAVNPYFMTVLVPRQSQHPQPVLSFDQGSDPKVITIEWPGRTDTITWSGQNYNVDIQESLRSDINNDGVVDLRDFSIFASDWLLCSDPANPECTTAD